MDNTQAIELVNELETEVLGIHFFRSRTGESILVERSIKEKFKAAIDKLSAISAEVKENPVKIGVGSAEINYTIISTSKTNDVPPVSEVMPKEPYKRKKPNKKA